MSYRRIFSLRELALCLVILANAIGLGAVILTTAVSASSTLEKVAAESSSADAPALAVERVDQGKVGTDDVHAAVDTTTEIIESLPELSSGKAAVSEQISVQVVEAPATTVIPITEESSNNAPLLNPAGDSSVEVPDVEPGADENTSPHAIPLDDSSSESVAAPTVNVVEPRTLEIAKAMLNADLEELMDSGLDFSSAIKEIDLMAEEERYGEFGKR